MTAQTFWQVGDRVVTRFWEPGEPVGTVKKAELKTDRVYQNQLDKVGKVLEAEWVTIRFDNGALREYAAWDLRKAPEEEA